MKGPKINLQTARILRQSAKYFKSKGASLPSRARVSKKRMTSTKAVSKALANFSENKFKGVTIDCSIPVAKPGGGAPISYHFFNTGNQLTGPMATEFVAPQGPLNLFTFGIGDNNDQRTGNYMYVKKTHMKLEVQMLSQVGLTPAQLNSTVDFRLMIIKANRKYNELGNSPDAGASIFLSTQNDEFGYDSIVAGTFLQMAQPINKRKWLVYRDQKFTLSPPATEGSSGVPGEVVNAAFSKYPVKKVVSFNLPVWKKTHFNNSSNTPDNLDTQWLIVLQACPTSYCNQGVTRPENYRVNLLGTTSCADN
ncbi:hypothetical protein [Shewanella sp.]|uniref:hypothetical protein n=3 Tax=Pseudomonadota TaxID=1224 RepID=UPI00404846F9